MFIQLQWRDGVNTYPFSDVNTCVSNLFLSLQLLWKTFHTRFIVSRFATPSKYKRFGKALVLRHLAKNGQASSALLKHQHHAHTLK